MSIRKKLGLGVASAALGLSLVAGGTFAYFNDTATINNSFASGTLDLSVLNYSDAYPINFDLSNLKPGDKMIRHFKLDNTGSLAIQNVWMDITADKFKGKTNLDDFLAQFTVNVFRTKKGVDNDNWGTENRIFKEGTVTLADIANGKDLSTLVSDEKFLSKPDNLKVDLASGGLSVNPNEEEYVRITIEFKDSGEPQNIYQNSSAAVQFNLEATQYAGQTIEQNRNNGYILQNEIKTQPQNPNIDTSRQKVKKSVTKP